MAAPTVALSNGQLMPQIGLGTWQAGPGEVERAVAAALDAGYRHIDCAFYYGNEAEVGSAIRQKVDEGAIAREELFVTSKLWGTFHRPDLVVDACRASLGNFGLDYLDLYLIHSPMALEEGGGLNPYDSDGSMRPSDVDFVDTWREMEKCVELGLAKSIGLSNFNSQQVQRVLDSCTVPPVVNQVECHVYLNQRQLIEFCRERGILVTAYSPLASPTRPWADPGERPMLEDSRVKDVAVKYGKSPAQVALRYLIQLGTVPVPKSVNSDRILENIDLFDFELSEEDVAVMDSFNCGFRTFPLDERKRHKNYPFHISF